MNKYTVINTDADGKHVAISDCEMPAIAYAIGSITRNFGPAVIRQERHFAHVETVFTFPHGQVVKVAGAFASDIFDSYIRHNIGDDFAVVFGSADRAVVVETVKV